MREKLELFGLPLSSNKKIKTIGLYPMPEEYFIERLQAQEDEIECLRATFEAARQRGNKKLMGISRKRLELALHLREMYQRLLKREGAQSQV